MSSLYLSLSHSAYHKASTQSFEKNFNDPRYTDNLNQKERSQYSFDLKYLKYPRLQFQIEDPFLLQPFFVFSCPLSFVTKEHSFLKLFDHVPPQFIFIFYPIPVSPYPFFFYLNLLFYSYLPKSLTFFIHRYITV